MSSTKKPGRRLFARLWTKIMQDAHQTDLARQRQEQQVKRQLSSAHTPPQLGTTAEQVTRARARAMQGAKSEFAKLMEELNQSREQIDVHEYDPSSTQ